MKHIILILFCIFLWACSDGEDTFEPEDKRRRPKRPDFSPPDDDKPSPFDEGAEPVYRSYTMKELRQYIESGQIDQIINFLKITSNANVKDADGHSLLQLAIINNNLELFNILLEDPRIDVNNKNYEFEYTALHIAVQIGNKEMVEKLASHPDIQINQVAKQNYTALHLSIIYENPETTQYLCDHPDINVHIGAGKEFITALHLASIYGPVETVQLLLSKGAHPLMLSKNKITALTLAINYENQDIIDVLVQAIDKMQKQAGVKLQSQPEETVLQEFTRKPPRMDIPDHSRNNVQPPATNTQTSRSQQPNHVRQSHPRTLSNTQTPTPNNSNHPRQNTPPPRNSSPSSNPPPATNIQCQNNARISNLRHSLQRCQEDSSSDKEDDENPE